MLRDEFCCPAIPIKPQARRVLVNFGGFDAAMQTHHAMLAMADFHELEVDFVAGADNPAWDTDAGAGGESSELALAQFCQRLLPTDDRGRPVCRCRWRHQLGAGGHGAADDLYCGLEQSAGQRRSHGGLGCPCVPGPPEQVSVEQLRQAIGFVAGNQGLRQSLAEHSRQLVDGRGAQRVAAALAGAVLQVRQATVDDAQLLFEGRNAEAVRRWSLETARDRMAAHQNWLTASLSNPRRLLLIAEADDGPVGVLRYDCADLKPKSRFICLKTASVWAGAGRCWRGAKPL